MTNREIVVLSAVRTPVGKFGGALKDIPPTELAATVVSESVRRSGLSAAEIGNVVFGNVIHTEGKDMYLAGWFAGGNTSTHAKSLVRQRAPGNRHSCADDRPRRLRRGNRRRGRVHEPGSLLAECNAVGRKNE